MKKLTSILLSLALLFALCAPALADGFNAGVEISEVQNDSFTVTVPTSNNTILAEKRPTLTVPCPSDWTGAEVSFGGSEIDSTFENGAVSFTVAEGGVYTITKAEADPAPNPDPDPAPTTPTAPTTTAEDKTTAETDEDGNVSANVSTGDANSGETVTLPVEVEASESAEEAPTVTVTVPESAGAVKVEIPVADVGPGDVVILVHEDGTEEILPKTALSEDGLVIEVEGTVTVKIVDNAKDYEDVRDGYWGEDAIDFVTSRELFVGVTAKTFAPEETMSRAMLATVLYRLESKPETDAENAFTDVADGKWYTDAIVWAAENGVVEGYGDSFGTNDPITREQLVTMLWRLAGKPVAESVDAGASSWAADAMSWAVSAGLIQGDSTGYNAKGEATRAETATILMRYINL